MEIRIQTECLEKGCYRGSCAEGQDVTGGYITCTNKTRCGICSANKGKVVPLLAWSGPEGSRKLRFPDFMTMAQGGGKVVSLTHRPHLPPGNPPGTHFC